MATRQGTVEEFTTKFGLTPQEGLDTTQTVQGAGKALGSDVNYEVPVSQSSNSQLNEPFKNVFNAPTPTSASAQYVDIDEDKVKRDVLQSYQGQLDATKGAYSQLLSETKQQGIGRLGESTAQQARGGLLGSDFGQAQTDKTREFNRKSEQDVLSSQSSAIAAIMSQANASARQAVNDKRAAKQYGYESLKQYNAEEATRKSNNLARLSQSLLLSGVDPNTLGKQLKDLAKSYGVTENDILNSYLENKSARDAAAEEQEFTREGILIDRAKTQKETEMIERKFEEDKRQFGLQYALSARKASQSSGGDKLVTINGRTYIQNADGSFSAPQLPGGLTSNLSPRALQALQNPKLLDSYTATERGAILDEIANGGLEAQTAGQQSALNISKQALTTLNELIANDGGLKSASGIAGPGMLIRGSRGKQFENKLNTLRAQIALPNLEFLAGLGRMSQEQFRTLQQASDSLERKALSNQAMRDELAKVQTALSDYIAEASTRGPGGLQQQTQYQSESGNVYELPY